jgi:hypothetical protein
MLYEATAERSTFRNQRSRARGDIELELLVQIGKGLLHRRQQAMLLSKMQAARPI